MKKLAFLCLFALFFSIICFPISKTFSADSIKIGLFLPESGPFSLFFMDIKRGAELAVDEINARGGIWDVRRKRRRPLQLILYDTGGGPEAVWRKVQRALRGDRVSALIGDLSTPNTLSLMSAALSRKIPLVSYGATALMPYKYKNPFFRKISPGIPNYATALAGYASKVLGVKRFGMLVSDDIPGRSYSSVTRSFLKALSLGEVVADERFPASTKDFAAFLTKIKNAKPDGLAFLGPPGLAGVVVRQARKVGFDKPIFIPEPFILPKRFLAASGGRTENVYMCSSYKPGAFKSKTALAFEKSWKVAFSTPPSALSATVYDSVKMLASVIEEQGTEPKKINDGLKELKEYDGVAGKLAFLPTDSIVKNMVITQWKKNEIVPIEVYKYSAKELKIFHKQPTEGPIEKD